MRMNGKYWLRTLDDNDAYCITPQGNNLGIVLLSTYAVLEGHRAFCRLARMIDILTLRTNGPTQTDQSNGSIRIYL